MWPWVFKSMAIPFLHFWSQTCLPNVSLCPQCLALQSPAHCVGRRSWRRAVTGGPPWTVAQFIETLGMALWCAGLHSHTMDITSRWSFYSRHCHGFEQQELMVVYLGDYFVIFGLHWDENWVKFKHFVITDKHCSLLWKCNFWNMSPRIKLSANNRASYDCWKLLKRWSEKEVTLARQCAVRTSSLHAYKYCIHHTVLAMPTNIAFIIQC